MLIKIKQEVNYLLGYLLISLILLLIPNIKGNNIRDTSIWKVVNLLEEMLSNQKYLNLSTLQIQSQFSCSSKEEN